MNLPPQKPHQARALKEIGSAREENTSEWGCSVLAVAPPGAGKSRTMLDLAVDEVKRGGRVLLKVHRKMLLSQLRDGFQNAGIEVGLISPDYKPDRWPKIQIASTQTLFSRGIRRGSISMPPATLVMNDEAHQQASDMERAIMFGSFSEDRIMPGYLAKGADLVGFTATPLMGTRIYDKMIDFATYSELRDAGMHQLLEVYGPDEIDTSGLKQNKSGEFSPGELDERVGVIFGSVYREWKKLNPEQLPAILFAPSVASSQWFAREFASKGIPVAHMDAERILLPGAGKTLENYASTPDLRAEVLKMSESGEIKMICNRFLLREAIDMPWLYHGIFATVMGATTSALQSVGRLQRYWPAYNTKIMQDHGGFYWRHGSPNNDRVWNLGDTNKSHAASRVEKLMAGEEPEGKCCPKCGRWRLSGPVCDGCGHAHDVSVRRVRSIKGKLKKMVGEVYRKPTNKSQCQQIWTSALYASGKTGKSISSAVALAHGMASKRGVKLEFEGLRNAPPLRSDPRWHMEVRTVYPWTVIKPVPKPAPKPEEPIRELELD